MLLPHHAEGGTWTKGANGEDIYVNPPQKADTCTNVAPDQRYTCQQQVCPALLRFCETASSTDAPPSSVLLSLQSSCPPQM